MSGQEGQSRDRYEIDGPSVVDREAGHKVLCEAKRTETAQLVAGMLNRRDELERRVRELESENRELANNCDHWKANHDRQVAIKRDLQERFREKLNELNEACNDLAQLQLIADMSTMIALGRGPAISDAPEELRKLYQKLIEETQYLNALPESCKTVEEVIRPLVEHRDHPGRQIIERLCTFTTIAQRARAEYDRLDYYLRDLEENHPGMGAQIRCAKAALAYCLADSKTPEDVLASLPPSSTFKRFAGSTIEREDNAD